MTPQLEFEYIENDAPKIWVKTSNGLFAGEMKEYISPKRLIDLAAELEGFPNGFEKMIFEIGKNEIPYAHCALKFYCFDSIKHTAVMISLSNGLDSNVKEDNRCQTTFKLQFEAATLDSFRTQLASAIKNGKGKAVLIGINAYTQNIN